MRAFRTYFILAISLIGAGLIGSCDFPYQPKEFVAPPPLYTFVPASIIKNIVGKTNVKIAFCRDGGAVYYVDYNDSTLAVHSLKKPAGYGGGASSPLLSPDGKWVTYFLISDVNDCEGFVQKLDPNADPVKLPGTFSTDPHWWRDPADGGLYIIYSDMYLQVNLSTLTGHHTYKQKVDTSGMVVTLDGSPQVIADKPMNGGLSKNGAYLCTGYAQAAFYNTVASDSSPLIPINTNPAATNPIVQTCNPSMTYDTNSDSTPRMMFLCFNGVQNLNWTDTLLSEVNVGMHEYIFVVDTLNTELWYIQKPAGYGEWQDPEWSNDPDFVAASLGTSGDQKYDGVIIRRSDKKIQKLIADNSYDKMDYDSKPYIWIGQ